MSTPSTKNIAIILLLLIVSAIAAFIIVPRLNATVVSDNPDAHMAYNISAHDFAPHKALYEVKLSETKNGSQIVNISGQMMYEWQRTCDSWLSDHRFNMLYEYAEAPAMRLVSNFSTFEAIDGSTLDFSSQRKNNGETFEEIRGFAEAPTATYRLPTDLTLDLPAGTLFPIAHTVEVAKQIKEGRPFSSAIIFDGSDTEGPVEVSSFIGKSVTISDDVRNLEGIDAALIDSAAHKVRLAFFPLADKHGAADYEMDLNFHENGVISDMVVEYDAFTVTQKLIALEALEPQCEGGSAKSPAP